MKIRLYYDTLVVYRKTLRKSLLPFCGCLSAVLETSFDFLENTWIATLSMEEAEEGREHVWVVMRWPSCVYFSLLKLAGVLELQRMTGQSITVLPEECSRSEVPCWDRNEPAVQTGVWGVGPGTSGLLYVPGEYKKNKKQYKALLENQKVLRRHLFCHHLKFQ